jgi:hypothetical protein
MSRYAIGIDIEACAQRVETLQRKDGSIDWVESGVWDPWNHGESTMGLAIAGRHSATEAALDALADRQESDGGWTGELGAGIPMDETGEKIAPPKIPVTARDTNFTGYVALTLLRSALALDTPRLLARHESMVTRALNWVIDHQCETGDIVWQSPGSGETLEDVDSLRAGNASLFKSLEAGLRIADALGKSKPEWAEARGKIANALENHPERFDRQGIDRTIYAMDWYYPVLTGVLTGKAAQDRIDQGWNDYVVADLGCRCVASEPWVTTAETAELAMACLSIGRFGQAAELLSRISALDHDGDGYWMGWQYELGVIWPKEKPSWTAAAMILAADAFYKIAPGSELMIRHAKRDAWLTPGEESRAY